MFYAHPTDHSYENNFLDLSDGPLTQTSKVTLPKSAKVQFTSPKKLATVSSTEHFKLFDAKAVARRSILSRRVAEIGT